MFLPALLTDTASIVGDDVDSGIAGLLMSVQSIVVVYHLASLQSWLQAIGALEAEAETLLAITAQGDLGRARLERRIRQMLRGYPLIQVCFLSIAIVTMSTLTVLAGQQMTETPWYFVELPGSVLSGIYVFSSLATFVLGYRKVTRTVLRLA